MLFGARHVIFPYCLDRQPNGLYVALNRGYKPIGFASGDYFDYSQYPIGLALAIDAKTAQQLSWDNSPHIDRIFLYSDTCLPERSEAHMQAYFNRLNVLAKLTFMKT